jgi:hypothetical protein
MKTVASKPPNLVSNIRIRSRKLVHVKPKYDSDKTVIQEIGFVAARVA